MEKDVKDSLNKEDDKELKNDETNEKETNREKRCIKCNNLLKDNDKYCIICGTDQTNPGKVKKEKKPKKKVELKPIQLVIIASVITLVVCMVLSFGLYMYLNDRNGNIDTSNKNVTIEMSKEVESLNLSISAGVILYKLFTTRA